MFGNCFKRNRRTGLYIVMLISLPTWHLFSNAKANATQAVQDTHYYSLSPWSATVENLNNLQWDTDLHFNENNVRISFVASKIITLEWTIKQTDATWNLSFHYSFLIIRVFWKFDASQKWHFFVYLFSLFYIKAQVSIMSYMAHFNRCTSIKKI